MARTGQLSFLGRVFASAIARRVAYVVVALILSALGVGTARAADTAGVAYSKCMGDAAMFLPKDTNLITKAGTCPLKTAPNGGKFYQCQYEAAAYYQGPVSIVTCGDYAFDSDNNECSKKPDYNGAFPGTSGPPKSGSVQCNSGCMQLWTPNGDGTWNGSYAVNATCSMDDDSPDQCKNMGLSKGYHVNNANGMCEPDTQECPDGKQNNAKGECEDQSCPKGMTLTQLGTCENERNECPAGQIKSPTGSCLPGEGQCAQGEAIGKDGTCKRDADGDGKPDEGEEDDDSDNKATFGGGDSCDSPPSCSGDVIMCGQARIQWRIDCNTRRDVNIQGGTCSSPPVCAGKNCKAMEYAQLLAQWRSACAAEKLLAKDAVSGDGKQPEWTKVGGMSQDPGAGSSADDTKVLTTKKISTDDLDQSGFGGGGSCPGFEAASGGVIATAYSATFASPPPMWCTYIARLRAGLIVVSACVSVFILARGVG